MNNFIQKALHMKETYPNEFKEAIQAFKNKMKQSAKERYYPIRYLHKLVNTLGNDEKIKAIKSLNKQGLPYDVIMRIMGGMSKYSGKITTKANRLKYYKIVNKTLRKNERNEIILDAKNKAQEIGRKRLHQESEDILKDYKNELNKLNRRIRFYEKKTKWKMKETLGNKTKLKEEYINKKMLFLKKIKEIGKKMTDEKRTFLKKLNIYGYIDSRNKMVYYQNNFIYNPMRYSLDFLVYYLFNKNITNIDVNYIRNNPLYYEDIETYNENKIKNLLENEFNNLEKIK